MKREALDHTKMKRLCRRLDIPLYQAVGILETIWQITAKQAPRGDIGKLTDEDIAIGLDYRKDESALIEALVSCGWLDRHPKYRLIVHDWDQHSDDALNMRMARARLFFCSGKPPRLSRLSKWEREEAEKAYASMGSSMDDSMKCEQGNQNEPPVRTESESERTSSAQIDTLCTPPSPPLPSHAPPVEEITTMAICAPDGARVAESGFELIPAPVNGTLKAHQVEWFGQWWKIYWRKVARKPAEKAFQKHVRTPERFEAVMEATRKQTPTMMARDPDKRPHPATWLNAERWNDEPSPPAQGGASRKPTMVENVSRIINERIAKGEKPW